MTCPRCAQPYGWLETVSQPSMCRRCWRADAGARRTARSDPTPTDDDERAEPLHMESTRPGARWITRHLAALARLPPRRFLLRVYFEMIVTLGAATVAVALLPMRPRADLDAMNDATLFGMVVVIAPLTETLMFQALFGALGRRLHLGFWWQLVLAWLPFAVAHFAIGVGTGLCAGLVGGFWFAYAYITQRSHSFSRAYWVTAALHALNNGGAVVLLLLERHGLI